MARRNKEVLKLAVDIYLRSKAYQALDKILDNVENSGLFNDEELKDLRSKTENGLLDEKMNEEGIDGLLTWWSQQPRHRRSNIELKISLIQRLIDCNDHESATELTFEILKNSVTIQQSVYLFVLKLHVYNQKITASFSS